MKLVLPGGGGSGMVQIFFWNLTHFTDFHFKNTSNLIFPDFKVSSKSFFPKNFKIGLTFWHTYLILRISKLSPMLPTYGWDTLYIWIKIVSELAVWPWACLKYFHSGAPDEDIYIGKLQKITATFSNYSTTKTWLR